MRSRISGDRCQEQARFPKEEEIENWFPARTGGVLTCTHLTGRILKLDQASLRLPLRLQGKAPPGSPSDMLSDVLDARALAVVGKASHAAACHRAHG